MSLSPGTRVGPYEIVGLVGAGGMGQVYRARDSRLRRDVAIKILPPAFAAGAEHLARFKREAQVLASLNHPHIAAIYGVEERPPEAAGGDYALALVLELVEGPTLADRIARGPIPVGEALPIARQIAEALEAAHDRGIVHRDLKPANIKLRPDGTVKVLDFGLAKAMEEGVDEDHASSRSPTAAVDGTREGVILGTASFMSPEQARGQSVDKRTDVWAFGCVLYEMLTGRRAFGGDNVSDILARVIEREPDFGALPPTTPATIRTALRRCLEKDRRRRLPDIGVVRLDIDDALAAPAAALVAPSIGSSTAPSSPSSSASPSARTTTRAWIAWPLAALVTVIGIAIGVTAAAWWYSQRSPSGSASLGSAPAPATRTSVELPATALLALGVRVPQDGFDNPALAISPDGRRLAYIAESPTGTQVHLRDLAAASASAVPGTEGAIYAFFSPDGNSLGFLTDDRVKKVALDGTAPVTLSTANTPVNATWTPSGQIYVAEEESRRLSRVSASGGRLEMLRPSSAGIRFSQVLPGERMALATVTGRSVSADYGAVTMVSIADGSVTTLVESGYDARFVPPSPSPHPGMGHGHLLFGRGGGLYAVAFDPEAGRITGEVVPVASDVSMESLFSQVHAAASANGVLVYVGGGERAQGRLAWIDRDGAEEDIGAPTHIYGLLDLSPDGTRLAAHVADVTDYVWVYDFARREGRKLAVDAPAGWPLWRPDGKALAFRSWSTTYREGEVLLQPVDGGSPTTLLPSSSEHARYPTAWLPDGVIATGRIGGLGGDFFQVERGPTSLVDAFGAFSTFSQDGKWVAYMAAPAGRFEVFISSFPAGDVTRQFSVDGGTEPLWCRSGELFYRKGNRWMGAAVHTTPELGWDPPRQVFQADFIDTPGRSYAVSPDGRRLLVVMHAGRDVRDRIQVVTNWTSLLPPPGG